MDNIVFTPASLLHILKDVEELKHLDVGITETIDNQIQLQVGDSIYILDDSSCTEVKVDSSVVETVDNANISAYEELGESGEITLNSPVPVESGIIKEIAKTLLVGGMIRLTAKLLK